MKPEQSASKPDRLSRPKALIIGATSGIGKEVALLLAQKEFDVVVTGRRAHLLEELVPQLSPGSQFRVFDVSRPEVARDALQELFQTLGTIDLILISAGTGHLNPQLDWEPEQETIAVNVLGFTAMATLAMNFFRKQGNGHLVAISSLAALRGSSEAPAYNASKAFVSNYLQGLRKWAVKMHLPITVTEVQPGLVDTAMAKGEGLFWVAPAKKAAEQIVAALLRKKEFVVVTKRWHLISWVLKLLPDWMYHKL
jgi:short-subunit dehydrogenase